MSRANITFQDIIDGPRNIDLVNKVFHGCRTSLIRTALEYTGTVRILSRQNSRVIADLDRCWDEAKRLAELQLQSPGRAADIAWSQIRQALNCSRLYHLEPKKDVDRTVFIEVPTRCTSEKTHASSVVVASINPDLPSDTPGLAQLRAAISDVRSGVQPSQSTFPATLFSARADCTACRANKGHVTCSLRDRRVLSKAMVLRVARDARESMDDAIREINAVIGEPSVPDSIKTRLQELAIGSVCQARSHLVKLDDHHEVDSDDSDDENDADGADESDGNGRSGVGSAGSSNRARGNASGKQKASSNKRGGGRRGRPRGSRSSKAAAERSVKKRKQERDYDALDVHSDGDDIPEGVKPMKSQRRHKPLLPMLANPDVLGRIHGEKRDELLRGAAYDAMRFEADRQAEREGTTTVEADMEMMLEGEKNNEADRF